MGCHGNAAPWPQPGQQSSVSRSVSLSFLEFSSPAAIFSPFPHSPQKSDCDETELENQMQKYLGETVLAYFFLHFSKGYGD